MNETFISFRIDRFAFNTLILVSFLLFETIKKIIICVSSKNPDEKNECF